MGAKVYGQKWQRFGLQVHPRHVQGAQSSQKLVSVYEVTQEGVTCYVRALVPSHTNLVPTHTKLGA